MGTYLHIWIADPKSVSEMTALNAILVEKIPTTGELGVVYERKRHDIYDMADGLTSNYDVKMAIVEAARHLQAEKTCAMFGVEDEVSEHSSPHGDPKYLGAFELPQDEE